MTRSIILAVAILIIIALPASAVVTINLTSAKDTNGTVTVLMNNGGVWQASSVNTGDFAVRLVLADPMSTGKNDIYVAGLHSLSRLYARNPSKLGVVRLWTDPSVYAASIAAGNVDGAGVAEIILGYGAGAYKFSYSGGAWNQSGVASTTGEIMGAAVGSAGSANDVVIFSRNAAEGCIGYRWNSATSSYDQVLQRAVGVAWYAGGGGVDIDGDGDTDYVGAGHAADGAGGVFVFDTAGGGHHDLIDFSFADNNDLAIGNAFGGTRKPQVVTVNTGAEVILYEYTGVPAQYGALYSKTYVQTGVPGKWYSGVTMYDIDGDGADEILACWDGGVDMFKYSNGSFAKTAILQGTGYGFSDIEVGDIGLESLSEPDIVTINTVSDSGCVSSWYQRGSTWQGVGVKVPGLTGKQIALADPTGSGVNDIYVAGSQQVARVTAASPRKLAAQTLFSGAGYDGLSLEAGDANQDGRVDILLGGSNTIKAISYDGSSWLSSLVATTGAPVAGLGIGDTNADGTKEIAAFLGNNAGTVLGYQWDGSSYMNNWSHDTLVLWRNGTGGVVDLTGDGMPDFVAVGADPGNGIILTFDFNTLDVEPRAELVSASFMNNRDQAVGDVDGDGTKDLVVITDGAVYKYSKLEGAWAQSLIADPARKDLTAVDVYDIDGDGKAEVFTVNNNGDMIRYDWNSDSQSWEAAVLVTGYGNVNTRYQDIKVGNIGLGPIDSYTTGGGQITITHQVADEGLYYDTPSNEVAYSVQILKTGQNAYRTVYHGEPIAGVSPNGDSIKTSILNGVFNYTMPFNATHSIYRVLGDPISSLVGGTGAGNSMVVKGKPGDNYTYVFFISVIDDNLDGEGEDFRHYLCQARTLDYQNFELRADVGGVVTWKPYRSDVSAAWRKGAKIRDINGAVIAGKTIGVSGLTEGMLGSICCVDGVYYYFYADVDTDGKTYLYYRTATDIGSLQADWSAAVKVSSELMRGTFIRVAKARGMDRWAVFYNGYRGPVGATIGDLFLQYTANMNVIGPGGISSLTFFDYFDQYGFGISEYYLGLSSSLSYAQHYWMTDTYGNIAVPSQDDSNGFLGGVMTWMDYLSGANWVYGAKVSSAKWSVQQPVGPQSVSVSIDGAKRNAAGSYVTCSGYVSAVFADFFYMESSNRAFGIRVWMPGNSVSLGQGVNVTGWTRVGQTTGERYIEAKSVANAGGSFQIDPLGMTNKSLGGGDYGDPQGGLGQSGVSGGTGLNNIGLLVRTTGAILEAHASDAPAWFVIDDGSGVGLRVLGVAPAGATYVTVTGISSCELLSGSNVGRVVIATAIQDAGN